MGVTEPVTTTPTAPTALRAPLTWATRWLTPLAWATLVANVVLVVTGGAVRLTGSGLGCPTWPRCNDDALTPRQTLNVHSAIEFGNRMLTFVLVVIAVATVVAAWRTAHRWLAVIILLGIPAQAVIGGISVLTDLNPWVVSVHLVSSMAIVSLAVLLLWRISIRPSAYSITERPASSITEGSAYDEAAASAVDGASAVPAGRAGSGATVSRPARYLAWTTYAVAWLVIYAGTVVTGAGPHAGDQNSPRNGLSVLQFAQLHADLVSLFIGLSVGLLIVTYALKLGPVAQRAAWVLLIVEASQATIGWVQYFTQVPIVLVMFHMLGAALIAAAVTWALLAAITPRPTSPRQPA